MGLVRGGGCLFRGLLVGLGWGEGGFAFLVLVSGHFFVRNFLCRSLLGSLVTRLIAFGCGWLFSVCFVGLGALFRACESLIWFLSVFYSLVCVSCVAFG